MGYDEYRERQRFDRDEEFGPRDYGRRTSGRDEESRWPEESSWGYGREYDEGYPERPRFGGTRFFEGEGRPDLTGGATEFRPEATPRYGVERYGSDIGWQGGYGESSGYLYGRSSGDPGLGSRAYRTPERWHAQFTTAEILEEPGIDYYGTSRHLVRIPRGRFTGRGPKGYQRSDERIREDVSEEFARNGELDASDIQVAVAGCVVTLEGGVEDREQKRLAEDIAEAAPGVREVNNNLKVKKGFFERLFEANEEEERTEAR
jgi:hypothetical protein